MSTLFLAIAFIVLGYYTAGIELSSGRWPIVLNLWPFGRLRKDDKPQVFRLVLIVLIAADLLIFILLAAQLIAFLNL